MKAPVIGFVALVLVGCGGGGSDYRVKSQQERLDEQLDEADADAARHDEHLAGVKATEADSDQAERFDRNNAEFELKRSSNNAVDCPNTLPAADLKGFSAGEVSLHVTFTADGSVKEVKLDTYQDTPVGDCISRAYESVRIKQFTGADETVDWKIELKVPEKKVDPKAPKKK